MIATASGLLVPTALVFWALAGTRGDRRCGPSVVLQLGTAMVLAAGVTSWLWFTWLELFGTPRWPYLVCETAALAAAAWWLRRWPADDAPARCRTPARDRSEIAGVRISHLTAAVLLLLTATWAVSFLATTALHPHGSWDAVAIWNLHAHFLAAGADRWDDFIRDSASCAFHGDYPLLVPVTVARLWLLSGTTAPAIGAFVSFWFAAALVLLCIGLVGSVRGPTQGVLAAATLLGTNAFIAQSSVQYADIPLAACMLAGAAAMVHAGQSTDRSPRWLVVAGAAAACAAWTKNEGLLFVLVVVAIRIAAAVSGRMAAPRRNLHDHLPFAIGLLPGLLVLAYFKVALAPANDLVAGQGLFATLSRIVTPGRYLTIAVQLIGNAVRMARALLFVLPLYVLLLGTTAEDGGRRGARTMVAIYGLMLIGYFAVYVTTPQPLYWHLNTSARRLLLQLWPGVVCAFFLLVAAPEERLA